MQRERACRLRRADLIAFADGEVNGAKREYVEAHLRVCSDCQTWLDRLHELEALLEQTAPLMSNPAGRVALLDRLHHEDHRRRGWSIHLLGLPLPQSLVARLLVALLVLLTALPVATQADFPLSHFVRFGEVETTQPLPPEQQGPLRGVAPSDPAVTQLSFKAAAPVELPLGLLRVEQSTPDRDRLELLYRNQADLALLVIQLPADRGMVELEANGTEVTMVQGTHLLITRDSRPGAVSSLAWERNGVFFGVMVIEAPTGEYGGFQREDALQVVMAMMAAQDAPDA